jgi:tetratricopeptide (TPR) repeat protein
MPPEPAGRPLADAAADYRRTPSPLALHDLLRAFAAACYEVARAHGRGTAHLGLTPRLVRLGELGATAVAGWDRPDSHADAYAAAFLAPEQTAGAAAKVGPAADVYALGAVLYALLTGQPPYLGETADEVLGRVRQGLPWQPRMVAAGVPAALEAVCLTAMEREPADRYASAAELAREIERWMAGQRVRTNYVEPKAARLAGWLRSRYGLLTLISLLAASLVCLAVAINVIRVERHYMAEDSAKLVEATHEAERRAQEHFAEVHRQRSIASDEFAVATQALRALAARAAAPSGDGATLAGFKEDVLRTTRDAARLLARRADQGHGYDLPAAHDRVNLADVFLALGDHDEARRHYQQAVEIDRQAAQARPDDLTARRELMAAARGLGQLCLHDGQPNFARNFAREAHAAAEAVVAAEPRNPLARRDSAVCLDLLADASLALHDAPAAREAFERMTADVEGYANTDPNNVLWRAELANTYIGRGKVERLDHAYEAALPWYERGIAILKPLKAEGKLRTLPQEAARLEDAERVADECRDTLKAVADVNFALKERGGETARRLLLGRAAALARLGRLIEADDTARTLRGLRPDDGANRYEVARCYALCAAAAGDGAARAEYAGRAVEELRAAAARGAGDVEKIEADADLDGLHADAGYRALVAVLKARRLWQAFPVLP